MQFQIDSEIFEKFPDVCVGAIVFEDLDNTGSSEALEALLAQEVQNARGKLGDETLSQHPMIAPWRDAYRVFGAKPKKNPSSIEALLKRVQKGDELRSINKLVDIYNVISLKYFLPIGGEDLDQMQGDLRLTFANDNEAAVALLGEPEERPPAPGEVIYKDDIGTICRRWNWREASRTKLTEDTKKAIVVIEALPPADTTLVSAALEELTALVQDHCGGSARKDILGAASTSIQIFG